MSWRAYDINGGIKESLVNTIATLTVTGNFRCDSLGVGVAASGVSGRATINENIIVSGVGPHAIGGATVAGEVLRLYTTVTASGGAAVGLRLGSGTMSAAANADVLSLGSSISTIIAAGTFTGLSAYGLNLAGSHLSKTGTGTIDNAATVRIGDAPSIGTNNYALWVAAGMTRLPVLSFGGTGTGEIHTGTVAIAFNNAANTLTRMYLTDSGILTLGTTSTAGAVAGNFVMGSSSAPTNSGAGTVTIYADTSAGKVRLRAIFPSGASQAIAAEP